MQSHCYTSIAMFNPHKRFARCVLGNTVETTWITAPLRYYLIASSMLNAPIQIRVIHTTHVRHLSLETSTIAWPKNLRIKPNPNLLQHFPLHCFHRPITKRPVNPFSSIISYRCVRSMLASLHALPMPNPNKMFTAHHSESEWVFSVFSFVLTPIVD